jgi:hypothetical protein
MHSHQAIGQSWSAVGHRGNSVVSTQAGPIAWFDETGGTGGYSSFRESDYVLQAFMGKRRRAD